MKKVLGLFLLFAGFLFLFLILAGCATTGKHLCWPTDPVFKAGEWQLLNGQPARYYMAMPYKNGYAVFEKYFRGNNDNDWKVFSETLTFSTFEAADKSAKIMAFGTLKAFPDVHGTYVRCGDPKND